MSELAKHIKALAEKQAGPISETLSVINPLNTYLGGSLLGGGAALGMPTRSLKQQANYDSTDNALRAIANVLVPGYGPYNAFKRVGAGIRSPEMKAIRADREQDKARRELEAIQKSTKKDDNVDKAAGWKTELAGSVLNPINLLIGNKLGAGAAALTQTRTLNEQSESDDSTWSNLFVPGQAQYNWWKRVGAATRSPEMLAMRQQAAIDRLEREAGTKKKKDDNEKQSKVYEASEAVDGMHVKHTKMNHKKCMPGEFGAMVKQSLDIGQYIPANISQHLPTAGVGAAAGAGLGALGGLISPGEEDEYDDNGRVIGRRQRNRFGAMLRNALMGAGVGGLAGGVGSAVVPGVADYSNQALQKLYGMFQQKPQVPTPNVYPANTTDYAALDADPRSQLSVPAASRVGMPQDTVPSPTAAEIPDLDAAGVLPAAAAPSPPKPR